MFFSIAPGGTWEASGRHLGGRHLGGIWEGGFWEASGWEACGRHLEAPGRLLGAELPRRLQGGLKGLGLKMLQKPCVFIGFWPSHGADVAKTLCFSRFLKEMLQKPYVFLGFLSDPGLAGSKNLVFL